MMFPILSGFFFPPIPCADIRSPALPPALDPGGDDPPAPRSGASWILCSAPLDVAGAGAAAVAYPPYSCGTLP